MRRGDERVANETPTDWVLERVYDRAWVYLNLTSAVQCDVHEIFTLGGGSTGRSRLFELHANDVFRKIFVKTYAPREWKSRDPERMQRAYQAEVKAMTELEQAFRGDGRYRLPRLLDNWDDLNTVVVEGVDAVPMMEAIRNTYRNSGCSEERERRVREVFRDIGGWLAHLHNGTYAGEGSIDVETVLKLNDRLEHVLASRELSETRVGRRIMRCNRRLLEAVEGTREVLKVPIARRHGDFSLRNLMIGKEGEVWGVDACGSQIEPVYVEVTQFLATLRMGRRRVRWGRTLRPLERSFLIGYGRGAKFPLVGRRAGLRICRVYSYLRELAEMLERREAKGRVGCDTWLERVWVRINYLWPVEVLMESAERAARAGQDGWNQ